MTTLTKDERDLYGLDGPEVRTKGEIDHLAAATRLVRDNRDWQREVDTLELRIVDLQTQINELTGEARAWEKSAKLAWAEVERQIEKRFGG